MTDSWHWASRGVDIQDGQLLWYDDLGAVSYASGAASNQAFEDFLAHGAPVEGVPDEVLLALRSRLDGVQRMRAHSALWVIPRWRPKARQAAIVLIVAASGWILLAKVLPLAVCYWFVVLFTGCVLAVLSASQPKGPPRVVAYRTIMLTLGFLAPIAVVLFLRLSIKMCAVANILMLPWGDGAELAVRIGALVVWAASTVLIIVGLRQPSLRGPSLVMFYWSLWAAIPAFFFFFLSVYGDPGPNCIPV